MYFTVQRNRQGYITLCFFPTGFPWIIILLNYQVSQTKPVILLPADGVKLGAGAICFPPLLWVTSHNKVRSGSAFNFMCLSSFWTTRTSRFPINNDRSLSNTVLLLPVCGAQTLTANLRSRISLVTERYTKRMKQTCGLNAIRTFFFSWDNRWSVPCAMQMRVELHMGLHI